VPENAFSEFSGNPRAVLIMAVLLWPAAFGVFIGHVTGVFLAGARGFTLTIIWLIGLGCLGAPFFGVRILGSRLSPFACRVLAAALGSVTVLLSVLFMDGEETPNTITMCFALILPMAAAIQSYNAADALGRQARMTVRYEEQTAGLTEKWRAAVVRAQAEHLEVCLVARDAQDRRLADIVDAATGLDAHGQRMVMRALMKAAAPTPEPSDQTGSVVPFPRVNGNSHN
jgi:hypothetical protein